MNKKNMVKLFPFLVWMRLLSPKTFYADFISGLTGAVIVLPQGIAYALIAGLPAEYGLYTAIITPIIAGLFGSSLHLISGPTAAISIVIFSVTSGFAEIGSPEFISLALTITLLTGVIQLAFGLLQFGALVNFISHTVVIGFTAGAAILIATSQLKYILSVPIPKGLSFIETLTNLFYQISSTNLLALTTALVTLLSMLVIKKINARLPSMIMGMCIGSFFCWMINGHNQGIVLVGALSSQLPSLATPQLSIDLISKLLPGAFAIALLGLVEAVSIARAIAIRSGQRIDGNQEFIGQGLSNIVGSFFSCYAGSGSFTRSGANYDSGAKTPMAAIFAALIVILLLVFSPQVTSYLPLPVVGGAILLIAWNLIDIPHILQIFRSDKQETIVLLVTFFSTLLIELEFAIYTGVILSLVLYLRRSARPTLMEVAPKSFKFGTDFRSITRFRLTECPQLKIVRIDGSIFFGAVDYIQRQLHYLSEDNKYKHILLHCPSVNFIDIAGADMLLQESIRLKRLGGKLSFCAMKNIVKDELESLGYLDKLGEDNFYLNPDDALGALIPHLDTPSCNACEDHIFKQCPKNNR